MKKVVIGFGILIVYAIYSLGMRHERPVLAIPQSLLKKKSSSINNTASVSSSGSGSSTSAPTNGPTYKDGNYTGSVVNAYYGNVQVSVSISGGKITDVKFLQYPNSHSTSVYINQQAMPYLKQETMQSQNANVQIISGATFTSQGFIQSLQSALNKA